jgi:O-antigen/teichoic acid export membrane protein
VTSIPALRRRPGAATLGVGSLVSGVLAYAFFALVTRGLGAESAAPVAVLWGYWGFAAAGITFPLQHWIARSVAADGREGGVQGAVPRLLVLVAVVTGASTLGAGLVRGELFDSPGWAFPLLVGGVSTLSAWMGLVRGVLTARHRFTSVAGVLVLENLVRCVVCLVLLGSGVTQPAAYGAALLAGFGACLGWPSAWRLRGRGSGPRPALAFLGGAAGGQILGQAVLTGGPVVLALSGGAARDVTALFAALALFRAPYTVAVGQVAGLTSRLTALVVARSHAELARLHRRLLLGTGVAAAAAGALGALAGPAVLPLVFGTDVTLGARVAAAVAVATTVAIANLVLTVTVLAHDRAGWIPAAWVVALVPGALAFLVAGADPLVRVAVGIVVVEVVAWCCLLVAAARPRMLRA